MRRTHLVGALLASVLAQGVISAGPASATVPEEAAGPAIAAEQAEEAVEYAEEAALTNEEAVILNADTLRRYSAYKVRKIRRLTREIGHVKRLIHRSRGKRDDLRRLSPASKRRALALPRARAKIKRERRHLHHLRMERRAIVQS